MSYFCFLSVFVFIFCFYYCFSLAQAFYTKAFLPPQQL
ncbi:hypothetical protein CPS_0447 [Colwellia psychrerythraea 34H]|uniref:Uncharacterized protein n=1 Tax=Colwellia psychrerythraea (strain 34H / ATCC BAA-681) TaxID=167879 RepID=Q489Q9_COLP3|nr:hypothetical protein CPS_0447 [Colwellia psychrerythraea 34H]